MMECWGLPRLEWRPIDLCLSLAPQIAASWQWKEPMTC